MSYTVVLLPNCNNIYFGHTPMYVLITNYNNMFKLIIYLLTSYYYYFISSPPGIQDYWT